MSCGIHTCDNKAEKIRELTAVFHAPLFHFNFTINAAFCSSCKDEHKETIEEVLTAVGEVISPIVVNTIHNNTDPVEVTHEEINTKDFT